MNIPNILTIGRILSVPVFVLCLFYDRFWVALLIFVGAGITDALDGLIARVYNQRTTTGAYLDPIADKLMLVTAFVVLAMLGNIPLWLWLTAIVIAKDVIVALGVLILFLTSRRVEVKPVLIGKAATFSQMVVIPWALLASYSFFFRNFLPYVIGVTAVLTCLSGLQYIYVGVNYLKGKGG